MTMPLEGIRVLDWTQFQQGPGATQMLGDLGGDAALSALTICEESEVLLFTIGVPADVSGPDMRHAFQLEPGPFTNAAALFKYVSEAHPEVKTASAIPDDTANVATHSSALVKGN